MDEMVADLNVTGQDIFSVSELRLQNGLQFGGTSVQDPGNVYILEWDTGNSEWDFRNSRINMNGNTIKGVGELNVTETGSGTMISEFTTSQIRMHQPLSVQSSGPLAVENGIELTGTDTNTIESYSTMYLETSSGSPTDIVLRPTGDVGVDANLSSTGIIKSGTSAYRGPATDIMVGEHGDKPQVELRGSSYSPVITSESGDVAVWTDSGGGSWTQRFRVNRGGPVELRSSRLRMNGNSITDANAIQAGTSGSGDLRLYTSGSGSSAVSIYDSSRSGNPRLLQANEGGPVTVKNANLDLSGNSVKNVDWANSDRPMAWAGIDPDDSGKYYTSGGISEGGLSKPSAGNTDCTNGGNYTCIHNEGGEFFEMGITIPQEAARLSWGGNTNAFCSVTALGDADYKRSLQGITNYSYDMAGSNMAHCVDGAPDNNRHVMCVQTATTRVTSDTADIGVMCMK
ncbi:MAG: hypothetical protein ABEJ07_06745 [Candidatus Nanohaloarchaea archaeon]